MIYINISLFILSLIGLHFSNRINNYGKAFISIFPILLNFIYFFSGVEFDFFNTIIPFVLSYLVIDQGQRKVYEVLPFAVLLLPVDINLKIIGFSACSLFNFAKPDLKYRSLDILKIAIICFLTLVDKSTSFKYLFTVYLVLSFMHSSDEDFAITDGVIMSVLLLSNIQHISPTLNVFLISLSILLFITVISKATIFKTVFLLSSIIAVLLNLETLLMSIIVFYYVSKSLITTKNLLVLESEVLKKYFSYELFDQIWIVGLLTLAFSIQNLTIIILSFVIAIIILLLNTDSTIHNKFGLQWFEFLYSLITMSLISFGLILFQGAIGEVDKTSIYYAISSYLILSLIVFGFVSKLPVSVSLIGTKINLGNLKRFAFLDGVFALKDSSKQQFNIQKSHLGVFALSYRSVRALSMIIMATYFLVLIIQVVTK
ncbi:MULTISPECIES: hypothetical protein [unclassified Halobacteriovorax]|uniref:hypothetical protein n=1 Tax=unclassified Halobacteriovorax TaxID=2639665 RepID=UPI00399A19F1